MQKLCSQVVALIICFAFETGCELVSSPYSDYAPRTNAAPVTERSDLLSGLLRVDYLSDTIMENDDRTIRLLGGSIWELQGFSLVLPLSEILIILTSPNVGTAYIDGDQTAIVHRSGLYASESGLLGKVISASKDGSRLMLNDGSVWSVPQYDRYDTGWWLPPYPVLITGEGLYLVNLDEGKRVWVSQVQ